MAGLSNQVRHFNILTTSEIRDNSVSPVTTSLKEKWVIAEITKSGGFILTTEEDALKRGLEPTSERRRINQKPDGRGGTEDTPFDEKYEYEVYQEIPQPAWM